MTASKLLLAAILLIPGGAGVSGKNATGESRSSDDVPKHVVRIDLGWLRLTDEATARANERLSGSSVWKELVYPVKGVRRFVRREPTTIDGLLIYRDRPACFVHDPAFEGTSGCMEVLIREPQSSELTEASLWKGTLDATHLDDGHDGIVALGVRKIHKKHLSRLVAFSPSIAIRVVESSESENRVLTTKWVTDTRELLCSGAPIELKQTETLLGSHKERHRTGAIQCVKSGVHGIYDLYGFVDVAPPGVLRLRVFDLETKEYTESRDCRDEDEVLDSALHGGGKSYWNSYVILRCTGSNAPNRQRRVRFELYYTPRNGKASETQLLASEEFEGECWRF